MTVSGRLRDVLRRDRPRVDADRLVNRVAAMERFANASVGHVSEDDLRPARAVVERAGDRLALSRDHTVVALAGATGSGKSSLFNALSGRPLSRVGVLRPTTGAAHACRWQPDGADGLLDWLGIHTDRRFTPERGGDDPQLRGLVLLDLPDFDSINVDHRLEVDRLLRLVDLVVWVTDPQKYADRVIHEQYLRTFRHHAGSTVVVLNQADRLSGPDAARCVADLAGLLTADGFIDQSVFAVSATEDQPGITALRQALGTAVTSRMAALERLAADVDVAVAASRRLVGPAVADDATDDPAVAALAAALANSAGVPAVTDATERAYRFRARASMGWPLVRWSRRLRTDPLAALRLGRSNAGNVEASSIPPPGPVQRSGADLAVRAVIERASAGLPPPWPSAVAGAARSHAATLPDALDQAVVRTDLGMDRRPRWWRPVGVLQWLLTVLALAGGLWLLARIVLIALGVAGLTQPGTNVAGIGQVPYATLALIGGLVAGVLLTLLINPLVALGARRARHLAQTRLRAAVGDVARDQVIAPVGQVLRDYRDAREALADAE